MTDRELLQQIVDAYDADQAFNVLRVPPALLHAVLNAKEALKRRKQTEKTNGET